MRTALPLRFGQGLIYSTFAILVVCILSPAESRSQWMVRNKDVGNSMFVKFLDEVNRPKIGFIGKEFNGMLRSTNEGLTWSECAFDVTLNGSMHDVTFKDTSLGWCVGDDGVFRTTDGGFSWTRVLWTDAVSVHYIKSKNRLLVSSWDRPAQVSTDLGDTWESFGPIEMNGIAAINDDQVLIMPHYNSPAMFTTNGGDSWLFGSTRHETWQPAALKGRKWWVAVSEGELEVIRSSDRGFNWEKMADLPEPTGCVRGNDDNLIAQTQKTVYRSTDQGATWTNLCGPKHIPDTRFWVRDNEIFILSKGVLWYNPTSTFLGNGAPQIVIKPSSPTFVSDGCLTAVQSIEILVNLCEGTLTGIDLRELTGGGEFAVDQIDLPLSLANGGAEIKFQYTAVNGETKDSAFVKFTITQGNRTFDTVITIYGIKRPAMSATGVPQALTLRMRNDCMLSKEQAGVRNIGCTDFTIDSFYLSDTLHFGVENLEGSINVLAGSAHGFQIVAKTITEARSDGFLLVYVSNAYGRQILRYDLKLFSSEPMQPALGEQSFAFKTTCDPQDATLEFTNPMCDTLRIDSVRFSASDSFKPLEYSYPIKLAHKQKASIPYRVFPPKPGPASATVTVFYTVMGEPMQQVTWLYASHDVDVELPADTVRYVIEALCPTFDSLFRIKNVLCDSIRILNLSPAIQPNYKVTVPPTPFALGENDGFEIGVSTDLYLRGTTGTFVSIRYEAYGVIYDTVIFVEIRNTNSFKIDPKIKKLSFGRVSVCAPQQRTVYLQNPYCLPMKLTSVKWSGSSSAELSTIYTPTLPRVLQQGERDSFVIAFAPQTTGSKIGALMLGLTVGHSELDTFFTIDGIGTGSMLANISDETLAMGTALKCEELSASTTVRNEGCEPLDIASLVSTPARFRLVSPTLPYTLEPGDSVEIAFATNVKVEGDHQERITLRLLSKQNVEQFLDCDLRAILTKEPRSLIFSGLSLDSLSGCAPTDTLITITSPSVCDTVMLSGSFASAGMQFLDGNDLLLGPGSSGTFRIRIQPQANGFVTLRIQSQDLDTTLPIAFTFSNAQAGEVTLSVPSTTFSTNACDIVSETYSITNRDCEEILITDLSLLPIGGAASRFSFATPTALPLRIPAGATHYFAVVFDPTVTGTNVASLTIAGELNEAHTLTGSFTPRQQFGVALRSAGVQEVIVGDSISVDVEVTTSVIDPVSISEIEMTLDYDTDMLTLTSITPEAGYMLVGQLETPTGLELRLRPSSSSFVAGTSLARLNFSTAIAPHNAGTITLSDLRLSSDQPRFEECILQTLDIATAEDVRVQYLCESAFLRDYMTGERLIKNIMLQPHPVSSNANGEASLKFESAVNGDATIKVYDVLGRERVQQATGIKLGENDISISFGSLDRGWHLLIIETTGGSYVTKVLIED
jgi:hypothetical protein